VRAAAAAALSSGVVASDDAVFLNDLLNLPQPAELRPIYCLLVLMVAVALDRRPCRPGKRNYIPIMIVAVAASLVLGRHLLTLMTYN
jgi:hypothetical protein